MVRVGIPLAQDEPLVQPYKNYKVIRDVSGASIAWPSTFVWSYAVAHKILFILNVALTYSNFHCRSRDKWMRSTEYENAGLDSFGRLVEFYRTSLCFIFYSI